MLSQRRGFFFNSEKPPNASLQLALVPGVLRILPVSGKQWFYSPLNSYRAVFFPGLVVCSLLLAVQGLYSPSDDVVELNASNFNREVMQSDSLWLVEFYAPW